MPWTPPADELVDTPKASGWQPPADELVPGQKAWTPPLSELDLSAVKPSAGVGLPSQFSSGELNPFSPGNPDSAFIRATTAPGTGVVSKVGSGIQTAGKLIWAGGEDALTQMLPSNHGQSTQPENSLAVLEGEEPPAEAAMRDLPTGQRILASGVKGLVESAPQMGIAAVDPLAGALAFGATPTGFDPKQAAIAGALPFIGKYAGAITEAIATKAGVSSEVAQAAFNKMGGAAGTAGILGADQINSIMQLPPDQRKDAWVDAVGNVGSMFLLGTMGERHQFGKPSESEEPAPSDASGPLESSNNPTAAAGAPQPPATPVFTPPADELVPGQPEPPAAAKSGVSYPAIVQRMMSDINDAGENAVVREGTKPPVSETSPPQNESKPAESATSGPIGETQGEISPAPTIAEKAAATPDAPVTLADLAALQREMAGNQIKPTVADSATVEGSPGASAEQTDASGAKFTNRTTKSGRTVKNWTQTALGKRVGDVYDEGDAGKVISVKRDGVTQPPDYTVTTYYEIHDGAKNEVSLRKRDMTPEEIEAKQEKMRRDNEFRKSLGQAEEPIPEPASEPNETPETSQTPPPVAETAPAAPVASDLPAGDTKPANAGPSAADLDEQDRLETAKDATGLKKVQKARLAELQKKNAAGSVGQTPVKDAAEVQKSAFSNSGENATIKAQNETPIKGPQNAQSGSIFETGKGKLATRVVERSAGADPGSGASDAAQKSALEQLYKGGQATVKHNYSRDIGEGGEHMVELSADGARAIKHTKGSFGFTLRPEGDKVALHRATPAEYVDRVHGQNEVFGDDSRIEGVSKAFDDNVGLTTSQKFIKGGEPSAPDLEKYLGDIGYKKVSDKVAESQDVSGKTWYNPDSGYVIGDVKPDNFKQDAQGNIHAIDTLVQHAEPGSEMERVMKLGTEDTKKTIGDKANSLADSLESLKTGQGDRKNVNSLGAILPYVWDGAINIAQGILRAGGKAADAVAAAIAHIRANHQGDFDEDGARAALQKIVPSKKLPPGYESNSEHTGPIGDGTEEPTPQPAKPKLRLAKDAPANEPPPEPEEDWQKLKQGADDANARSVAANEAIRNAPRQTNAEDNLDMESHATAGKGGVTPEMRRERADAQAAAQQAREKLLRSPGYIRSRIDDYAQAVKAQEAAKAVGDPTAKTQARLAVEEFHNEFAQMPPKAFAEAWKAAQDAGKLPKEQPLPVGRSLRELTDRLEKADIDSPKVPLLKRMALGKQVADSLGAAGDALSKARRMAQSAWEALKSGIYNPPANTAFREVMKDWFAADQQTGHETYRWQKAIEDKVSDPLRRKAISAWIEAGGDEDTLRAQLADLQSIGSKHVPTWATALKLTEGEKQIGGSIKEDFEQKLEDAKNVGMIDKGRENYGVPQIWKTPPKIDKDGAGSGGGSAGNYRAKLDPRDPFFSLQREVPSYFDGIMKGGEPKNMDVGKLVAVYNEAFHKNLSSRAAIWGLKDAKAADGTPVVKISGDAHYEVLPKGGKRLLVDATRKPGDAVTKDGRTYRPIDHWALKGWQYKGNDPHGNPVLVKGDFLVHPDHFQFLNNELNGAKWRLAEPGPVGADGRPTMKRTALGALGHGALSVSSFLKSSKMALGMFHLFNVGTHSVWNGVSPITKGFKIDFSDPKQAEGIRNGLELGFGQSRVQFEDGQTGAHGGLWSHVPGLGAVAGRMTDFIFKDALPKMKMKNYLALNEANTARYGKQLSPDQISEISARQSNDAFGLQNYRLLGSNKVLMDMNRLLCLAPDFLGSEMRQTSNAFTKYGGAQRRAIIVQTAAMYATARVVNAALNNGNAQWQPENALSVIYKGRSYSIRSVVADMFHMITDPAAFAAGRLGPLPHTIMDMITGRDMRFGTHIDTIAKGGISRATEIALRDAAGWLAPIGTTGFGPGSAKRGESPLGTLAAAQVGLASRQYTAQTQMYDLASRFNRSNPDPKAQEYQAKRDADVRSQGAYTGLTNLIQAGSTNAAKAEYQVLIHEGHTPEQIEEHYARPKPFTGSQEREAQFVASLNPGQKQTYQDALMERRQLSQKFAAMPK